MARKKSTSGTKRVTKKAAKAATMPRRGKQKRAAAAEPVPVESIRHRDTRVNTSRR